MQGYRSPEEGAAASFDQTEKALGAVVAMLLAKYREMEERRRQLMSEDDPDVIADLEWQLKLNRQAESSLQRIMSGLQSRLKAP